MDLLRGDHLRQDVPLVHLAGETLCGKLALLALTLRCNGIGGIHLNLNYCGIRILNRKYGGASILLDFIAQFVRGGLDGHTGAMERKGPQSILALEAVVTNRELSFGQAECMAQMQSSVHVRVRKSNHVLRLRRPISIVLRHALEGLILVPFLLHSKFISTNVISSRKRFRRWGSSFASKFCHTSSQLNQKANNDGLKIV